jgi:hypothetical protein
MAAPATGCTLEATLVGYRRSHTEVTAPAEMEIILTPDNLARKDQVEVRAGPFDELAVSSPTARGLTGTEMQNLAGVLIGDPLRAVQSLPGVASSNDYQAQFTVRGAPFDRIGITLDGILLHSPFHAVQSQEDTGSLSVLNAEIIEDVRLHAGAPPPDFSDRSAGALGVNVREGSRRDYAVRVNAGVASAGALAEGPLGRGQRGSWLLAARKSYLQYLIDRGSNNNNLAFGFFDTQGKLSYDLTPRHTLVLGYFDGVSNLDRSSAKPTLGVNSIMTSEYHTTLIHLDWRWAASDHMLWQNQAAWMRERGESRNMIDLPLGAGGYGEWTWNSTATWNWRPDAPLQAGGGLRRLRDDGYTARYNFTPLAIRRRDPWSGTGLRGGAWFRQDWTPASSRWSLSAGMRTDGYTEGGPATVSPYGGVLFRAATRTTLQAAWSQAVQYAPISLLRLANTGNPWLLPERANHAVMAVEQRLDDRTRLRAEVYWRADRDLIAQPLSEPRLLADGRIFNPPASPQYLNSVRGTAKGFELMLQRRTANRLTGWVSYGYAFTSLRDGVTGAVYPADAEQRHTVNAYGSYRMRPSVNLSARYSYGSNFPIPGFLRQSGALYYLTTARNQLRLPEYQRLDLRLNKSYLHKSWRATLYVEVLNTFNHENRTYDSFGGYNNRTGQAYPSFLKLFPIVPAAGVMIEWDRLARP